jgi:SOS-response transcriptional repressor LexA
MKLAQVRTAVAPKPTRAPGNYEGLTPKQAELLSFLRYRYSDNGLCPSFQEIKDACGFTSKSDVHRLIEALVERGYASRLRNRHRAITVYPESLLKPAAPVSRPLIREGTRELIGELELRGFTVSEAQA